MSAFPKKSAHFSFIFLGWTRHRLRRQLVLTGTDLQKPSITLAELQQSLQYLFVAYCTFGSRVTYPPLGRYVSESGQRWRVPFAFAHVSSLRSSLKVRRSEFATTFGILEFRHDAVIS